VHLAPIDWFLVIAYLVASLGVGVYYSKKASSSKEEYFLSGRSFPWWVVGTSMVATTFAADTPLALTEYVRQFGIWQNWYWWSAIPASLLAIFLFSRLWRRAEVLTENELIEIRYSGKPAAFLRGFKALFFATIFNLVIMGWVLNAMTAILSVLLEVEKSTALWGCASVALIYAMLSGFYGVVVTDVVQFFIATVGAYGLAFLSIHKLGGMEAILSKIDTSKLDFFPPLPGPDESFLVSPMCKVVMLISMAWWCRFDVDGGGYIVQRMSSAKNEAHAAWGTLWFYFLFYVVRAWPWILVALASMVAFPDVSQLALGDKAAYPMMVRDFLGPGMKGLLVVSFLAAFMSTIDTHLNWGASYLVHDLYARFIKKDADPKHYVRVSQLATLALMILAVLLASQMKDISSAWEFLMSMGAGAGLVLLMRWFWWRLNAWSELAAMASSISLSFGLELLAMWQHRGEGSALFEHLPVLFGVPLQYHLKLLVIVPLSLLITILVTLLTKPEPQTTLRAFYQRVSPGGWWKPEHVEGCAYAPVTEGLLPKLISGTLFLVGGIFSVGYLCLGFYAKGVVATVISLAGFLYLLRTLREELSFTEGEGQSAP
jgi:solute:Na+ symporter, SSS family